MFRVVPVLFVLGLVVPLVQLSPSASPGDPPPSLRRPVPPRGPPPVIPQAQEYKLCSYSQIDYDKCIHTLHVAQNRSIDLRMHCLLVESRENCLAAVRRGTVDLVVLEEHDYAVARATGLRPAIFERVANASVILVVAPRNVRFVDLLEAPLDVDVDDERAFHAAAHFNIVRGHNICSNYNPAADEVTIRIVDSADYTPSEDEILICPTHTYREPLSENYQQCNFEASLQRAAFVRPGASPRVVQDIRGIFNRILEHFGPNSPSSDEGKNFNFFDTFEGKDDAIFGNNAIAFDLQPTYRNGVTERFFERLHCNQQDQVHDPNQLE